MRLLFEIKDTIEDVKDTFLNKVNFDIAIPNLEGNTWYGPSPTTEHINQLSNPNPDNIEERYGIINDTEAARRFGARSIEEYSFWAWRSCAIVALASVLEAKGTFDKNNLYELVREALLLDGYAYKNLRGSTDIGWKHKIIAQMAESRGHNVKYGRYRLNDIMKEIYLGNYVIISVKSETGGHMVVINKFRQNESGHIEFDINDPFIDFREIESPLLVDLSNVSEVYLGRAIIIS